MSPSNNCRPMHKKVNLFCDQTTGRDNQKASKKRGNRFEASNFLCLPCSTLYLCLTQPHQGPMYESIRGQWKFQHFLRVRQMICSQDEEQPICMQLQKGQLFSRMLPCDGIPLCMSEKVKSFTAIAH